VDQVVDLLRQLGDSDRSRRVASGEALASMGETVIPMLLAAVIDERSPIDAFEVGRVLRAIGRPGLDALTDALVMAPTPAARSRCEWAFERFGPDFTEDYVRALSHHSAVVRHAAASGLQFAGEAAAAAVPALVPLLADPDNTVRYRVICALWRIGRRAIPALQAVRRDGPGRQRPAALTAMAMIDGERALSLNDRRAVERLIRVKLSTENSQQVDREIDGPWVALPTNDQSAVLRALDLSDPRPATMELGYNVACIFDGRDRCVFVTPVLNGWTLAVGRWFLRWGRDSAVYPDAARDLSRQFGRAQAYWYNCGTMESAWAICADGRDLHRYDVDDWDPDEDEEEEEDEREWGGDATIAAAVNSVSPTGPFETMQGHGVLALTAIGRERGTPSGAPSI
jgi:hypothetical protein